MGIASARLGKKPSLVAAKRTGGRRRPYPLRCALPTFAPAHCKGLTRGHLGPSHCDRSGEAVNLLRVGTEDGAAFGFAHGDLDGEPRVIVVPVRIVARIHQPIPADPIAPG